MEWVNAIAALIIAVILPFLINLCTTQNWSSNAKRWLAIVASVGVGLATGVTAGLPTPETLVVWVLAVLGGVQTAYAAFKAIGITDSWLDALAGIGSNVDGTEDKQ